MIYTFIDLKNNQVVFHAYDMTPTETDRIGDLIKSFVLEERDRAVNSGSYFRGAIERKEADGTKLIRKVGYDDEVNRY